MDYTTLGPLAALLTAVVGGICGIAGLIQSSRRGRNDDAAQLLADHRALVDEYRQEHAKDLRDLQEFEDRRVAYVDRIATLEAKVETLEQEHEACQKRLKSAEELIDAAGIARP